MEPFAALLDGQAAEPAFGGSRVPREAPVHDLKILFDIKKARSARCHSRYGWWTSESTAESRGITGSTGGSITGTSGIESSCIGGTGFFPP
jgi:hypothetical protein